MSQFCGAKLQKRNEIRKKKAIFFALGIKKSAREGRFQGNDSDEKLDPSKTEYIIYAMYVGADLKKPAGTALFKQSVTVN